MSNLLLNKLKKKTKKIHIKNYKDISKEELLRALNKLDKYSKNNSNNARTKKIRDKFLIPKVEEIERKLYEIEDINNLSKKNNKRLTKISLN